MNENELNSLIDQMRDTAWNEMEYIKQRSTESCCWEDGYADGFRAAYAMFANKA